MFFESAKAKDGKVNFSFPLPDSLRISELSKSSLKKLATNSLLRQLTIVSSTTEKLNSIMN